MKKLVTWACAMLIILCGIIGCGGGTAPEQAIMGHWMLKAEKGDLGTGELYFAADGTFLARSTTYAPVPNFPMDIEGRYTVRNGEVVLNRAEGLDMKGEVSFADNLQTMTIKWLSATGPVFSGRELRAGNIELYDRVDSIQKP